MQATHMRAQKTIDGIDYPATRAELIEYAVRRGADDELLADLRRLPTGRFLVGTTTSISVVTAAGCPRPP